MSTRLLRACIIVAVTGACAKAPAPETAPSQAGAITTADAQPAAPEGRRNRDVITREEIASANVGTQTVLEVITALRPAFLSVRGVQESGASESGRVHVSIDGGRIMSTDELRGIVAGTVKEIRFLNLGAAMQKFGGAALQGPVILVTTM